MHRDPLWIIVACRQIKNKRAPEQISTGAAGVVAGGSGEEVSKHVGQMKRRGR
jgi:hypothetical protein